VACTFALVGDRIVTAVDDKPKRRLQLQRLTNLAANPGASLLVDLYSEDWRRLWWVRADGQATIRTAGPDWQAAIDHLAAKYSAYRVRPPTGAVISMSVDRWSMWVASAELRGHGKTAEDDVGDGPLAGR
jgi:PPOX class probable F420-dependent enzyme